MAKASASATAAKKAPSKSEVTNSIAELTGLSKKEIGAVFEALGAEIKKALSNKGPGMFAIPGLVKIGARRSRLARPRRACLTPSSPVS